MNKRKENEDFNFPHFQTKGTRAVFKKTCGQHILGQEVCILISCTHVVSGPEVKKRIRLSLESLLF